MEAPAAFSPASPGYSESFFSWASPFLADDLSKLAASLAVFLVALFASCLEELAMVQELTFSFIRPVCQLFVVGFLLQFLFSQPNILWTLLPYLLSVLVGGYTAGQRAKHVPRAQYVAGASIFVGTWITMSLLVLLGVFPLTPRYMIPVAGLTVGRAMVVTGITLNRLRDDLRVKQDLVETALALGATPRQACRSIVRGALAIALAPLLDTAKTFGLVSLPGAMTGMMLAGASPLQAIVLQIVIMNALLSASFLSSIAAARLGWSLFFTDTYQLRSNVFVAD